MLLAFNACFFTLLLFCAFVALGQWRLSRDAAIPWYIGYLGAAGLHYGRQFWLDVSGQPGVPALPDPPLEWDTPLSYAAFACYFLFVRQMMQVWTVAPWLSSVLVALAWFFGLMSGGHLLVQAVFGYAAAESAHLVFQVLLLPALAWLTWNVWRHARLFYQKLILAGTAALVLGFLCAVVKRRWPGGYEWWPDMICCFPTRWGEACLYHLKVGVALDVLCFSWALALRQKGLLQGVSLKPAAYEASLPEVPISTPEALTNTSQPDQQSVGEEALADAPAPPMVQQAVERPPVPDGLLAQVDAYLALNYHRPELQVGDIAAEVNTSAGNLNRRLKNATGLTTEQYLLRYRLARAREMLLAGERSVAGVAEACGFGDVAHFSRAFKKCYGISPSTLLSRGKGQKNAV